MRRIRDRLREVYGIPVAPPHGRGLDELILTVLSQSTNDRNRDVAFLRLRRRFGAWEAVRDAPNEEVEEAIRPGGISKVKSRRIQEILRVLPEPLDGPHLEDRDFLLSLPGVGRKT
ncbi:MAG TPA: DNA lyase, partial [Solirubrobacteraceae bacterium]|nr:DNA lyase [Solirubrobacteraceae bacterium]